MTLVAAPAMAWGLNPPKCHLTPTVKNTDQESGGKLCKIFEISIVSAVCKQLRRRPSTPVGDFRAQDPLSYSPQMKFLAPPLLSLIHI